MFELTIRQGNERQNNAFTGPLGSLSINTDVKTLRLHDGLTEGGFEAGNKSSLAEIISQFNSLGVSDVVGLSAALEAKAALVDIGVADGITALDTDGKIPSGQLPSFVDDILEYPTFGDLPETGESGKLYVDQSASLAYRWNGTSYSAIAVQASVSDQIGEGTTNLYFDETRVIDALLAAGDLSFNGETGVLSFTESITSVNGQEGEVALTKNDVGLSLLNDNYIPSKEESESAQSGDMMMTPLATRHFMEAVGVHDNGQNWELDDGGFPPIGLEGTYESMSANTAGGVIINNGRVAVVGDDIYVINYGAGTQCLRYDTANETWHIIAALPPHVYTYHQSVEVIDGELYTFGYNGDRICRYDRAGDSWDIIAPLAGSITKKEFSTGFVFGTKYYVVGHGSGIYSFDVSNSTWTVENETLPTSIFPGAEVIGDKAYIFNTKTYVFDLTNSTLAELSSYESQSAFHVQGAISATIGTDIYLLVGSDATRVIRKYDTLNDTWEEVGTIVLPYNAGNAHGTAYDNKILAYNAVAGELYFVK